MTSFVTPYMAIYEQEVAVSASLASSIRRRLRSHFMAFISLPKIYDGQ